jgi:hypothetical protein
MSGTRAKKRGQQLRIKMTKRGRRLALTTAHRHGEPGGGKLCDVEPHGPNRSTDSATVKSRLQYNANREVQR